MLNLMLHFWTGINSLIPHLQLAQDGLKMAVEQIPDTRSLGRAGEKIFTTKLWDYPALSLW